MTPDTPLVSIIIPTYNGSTFLHKAIESALSQNYPHIEIVVSDDRSQDDTVAVIERYNDRRVRLIQNEVNLGLTSNLNKAIDNSNGDYICWLNQDDVFYADKLEKQLAVLQSNPKIGACFCEKDDIDANDNLLRRYNPSQERIPLQNQLLQLFGGCYLTATSVMMPRTVWEKIGPFNICYQIAFDFDMWFRIRQHYQFHVIEQSLIAFRHHANNLSGDINSEIVNIEAAAIVSNGLRDIKMDRVFPSLSRAGNARVRRYENASCLLILARLIWSQKTWSHLLLADILSLTAEALRLNPELLGAYTLAIELSHFMQNTAAEKEYKKKWQLKCSEYQTGVQRLGQLVGDQNLDGIRVQIEKLLSMSPGSGDPYYRLAAFQAEYGQSGYVLDNCRKALNVNPDHEEAMRLLAKFDATSLPQPVI